METAGIIAEYNPFHKGHSRQIHFLREMGIKQIVVVMSGDWVQRGEPAWTDKYLRTKMALEEGADLVFELPVLYALSGGEGFAFGSVSMLDALSLDCFCFGSECGKIEPLRQIADFLADEPEQYRQLLKEKLRQGVSYPAARECALSHFMPEVSGLIARPNNILGIEYLKAVKCLESSITPVTLQRNDKGYHGEEISSVCPSSAAAVRKTYARQGRMDDCREALPDRVYSLLQGHPGRFPVESDDFSSLLYYSLKRAVQKEELTNYGGISRELSNRIKNCINDYENILQFAGLLKTKNMTHSHITRSLFHVLLGMENRLCRQIHAPVPYLRILGMRQRAGGLLRRGFPIPVITKVADYKKVLADSYSGSALSFAAECFELDIFAADLYRQTVWNKTGEKMLDEYRTGIMIQEE